jgi:hypothetical protein
MKSISGRLYKKFVLIKKQMNVEIMQWDLRLLDVVKFKSIISLAQLHGQLSPPPALPFRGHPLSREPNLREGGVS